MMVNDHAHYCHVTVMCSLDIKADDQGLRLTDVLKSKEKFKNAFMVVAR